MRKHHTMSCPYPEGCSCGAAEYNNLLDQLYRQEQELAPLRAKAKAYDEGKTIYAIFDRKGQIISECSSALAPSLAWDRFVRVYVLSKEAGIEQGYTCRKVRVCKEVES